MKWIDTHALLELLPGARVTKTRLLVFDWLGKREMPERIPFDTALGVAAALSARDRGVHQIGRVVELVRALDGDPRTTLLVYKHRKGPPLLIPDDGKHHPWTIIELNELVDIVESCFIDD
ncbi:MAG: hypothetical protein RLZZ362_2633 [Actinomycetota bacterium]|jgi:hypothetical protein